MKKFHGLCLFLTVGALMGIASTAKAESVVVVEIVGYDGNKTFEIMNSVEYRTLTAELRKESSVLRKAQASAEEAWNANEEYEGVSFPASVLKPRRARSLRRFTKREDAEKAMGKLDEKEQKQRQEREDRERAKEKQKIARKVNRYKGDERKEKQREEQAVLDDKKALQEAAFDLFVSEIQKLLKEE